MPLQQRFPHLVVRIYVDAVEPPSLAVAILKIAEALQKVLIVAQDQLCDLNNIHSEELAGVTFMDN